MHTAPDAVPGYPSEGGTRHDDSSHRNPRRMAGRTPRAARRGKGADAAKRRTRAAAHTALGRDKTYRFDTEDGQATLDDLFRGRSQLLVYHFMFGPDYKAGCPSCSSIADGFDGFAVHLANHDVTLAAVSRAPLAKLLAYRQRMGWHFRGRRRSAAISTSTSTCRSPSAAAPATSSTTTRGPVTRWTWIRRRHPSWRSLRRAARTRSRIRSTGRG